MGSAHAEPGGDKLGRVYVALSVDERRRFHALCLTEGVPMRVGFARLARWALQREELPA